jgi:hypothetical protein
MKTITTHKVINGHLNDLEASIADLELDGWELVTVLESHHNHAMLTAFMKKEIAAPAAKIKPEDTVAHKFKSLFKKKV